MLVAIDPADMLLIHDWKVVRIIQDQNPGNKDKCWISPIPGFDEETLPFLVCSGSQSFNLINVKTGFL